MLRHEWRRGGDGETLKVKGAEEEEEAGRRRGSRDEVGMKGCLSTLEG